MYIWVSVWWKTKGDGGSKSPSLTSQTVTHLWHRLEYRERHDRRSEGSVWEKWDEDFFKKVFTSPGSTPRQWLGNQKLLVRFRVITIVTDNIECTVSFWWRGQGRRSWCFHPEMLKLPQATWTFQWRCYRQIHRTTPIQWACLVRVQGLWSHVLRVCVWELLVYQAGMDSLSKEEEDRAIRS